MRISKVRWGRTMSDNYQGRRFDVEIEVGEGATGIDALEGAQWLVDKIIMTKGRSARRALVKAATEKLSDVQLRVVNAFIEGTSI